MKPFYLILASALLLASCNRADQTVSRGLNGAISIWTDKETGCQYVLTDDNITPRLKSDGLPACGA